MIINVIIQLGGISLYINGFLLMWCFAVLPMEVLLHSGLF